MKGKYYFLLIYNRKQVTTKEGEKLRDDNMISLFLETSAKSGFNVIELFCHAAKILYTDSLKKSKVDTVSFNIKYLFVLYIECLSRNIKTNKIIF